MRRAALCVCLVVSMLAGCANASHSTNALPLAASNRVVVAQSSRSVHHALVTETVLHHFRYQGDGVEPSSGLTRYHGILYGTTLEGGGTGCVDQVGCGTVFSITPTGTETVLYSFIGGSDGAFPNTSLINLNGTFYGTAVGGSGSDSTIFSVTPLGAEAILHTFTVPGSGPTGPLLNISGTLYGTAGGGTGPRGGGGTIFTITPLGTETVLYNFSGYKSHGSDPGAPLVKVNSILYGTTASGGTYGKGAVFLFHRAGREKLLHSFGGSSADGAVPNGGLTDVNGTLYGTTRYGGTANDGTIFSITPSGTETVLYSFLGSPNDGQSPNGGLTYIDGILYGTTLSGGLVPAGDTGNGTVFSITPSGTETVLYSFLGPPKDGQFPNGGLVYFKGKLYGTTESGGRSYDGTVFSITP